MKVLRILQTLSLIGVAGCMSVQNQAVTESIQKGESPFVEAQIEYSGPPVRWAGPSSWVVQVDARQVESPKIHVSPEFTVYNSEKRELAAKAPAAPLDGKVLRESLKQLAQELRETPDPVFRGCLSPIKVRLLKEDGGLTERVGCRGTAGFARVVSEATARFLASVN